MKDYDYDISSIRPKFILELLNKHTELNDLNLSDEDDDGIVIGCIFGPMKPVYEHKKGTEYGNLYGINNYHKHDFRIRINGKSLLICKNHLKLVCTLSKELAVLL